MLGICLAIVVVGLLDHWSESLLSVGDVAIF